MFEIELKMKDFLNEPIESSGDAFVVFDSFRSMSKWIEKFKITHTKRLQIMYNSWLYKLWLQNNRDSFRESLAQLDENNELVMEKQISRKMTLSMSLAKNPVDIIWINMGGTKGIYFFRRYLWNILGLFLIIFISTPIVIMKTLQKLSSKNINLQFVDKIPLIRNLSSLIPTLTTVAINLALILLIDHSAVTEKHSTHSTFQSAIFNKAIIYLHLNMVFFPFLSLQGQPIFNLLKTKQVPTEYIRQFTMINTSSFFVNLMIQYGVFTGLLYFLRLGDLFSNHFSPTLADTRRKAINNGQVWRRPPDWVFQYGFFSCQMVTIFTIGMLFSFISPIVTFGCIVFYLIRNMVDSFLLLTVHKKECESKLFLYHKVLIWCLWSIMFYQIFIFCLFLFEFSYNSDNNCWLINDINYWIYRNVYNTIVWSTKNGKGLPTRRGIGWIVLYSQRELFYKSRFWTMERSILTSIA